MGWFRRKKVRQTAPELGAFYTGDASSFSDMMARDVRPARIAEILRQAEGGALLPQLELFERFEHDAHLFGVLNRRRSAAIRRKMVLEAGEPGDSRSEDAAEFCRTAIGRIPKWKRALFDLTDAIGKAFAVGQLVWDYDGTSHNIAGIERWSQKYFVPARQRAGITDEQRAACEPDELYLRTPGDPWGRPLDYGQWVVHVYRARSTSLSASALLRVVTIAWIAKHYPVRDWLIFSEAYGMPRRVGKYPPNADQAERDAVKAATLQLGRDAAAVIPEGASLELLAAKVAAGELPFPELIKFANTEMSKAIAGQTLTTEAGDRGARSLGEVHREIEAELTDTDAEALGETVSTQICGPLTLFNFGPDVAPPVVTFPRPKSEDLLQQARVDAILVGQLGLRISQDECYERYGRRRPEEGEEVVTPPAPAGGVPR